MKLYFPFLIRRACFAVTFLSLALISNNGDCQSTDTVRDITAQARQAWHDYRVALASDSNEFKEIRIKSPQLETGNAEETVRRLAKGNLRINQSFIGPGIEAESGKIQSQVTAWNGQYAFYLKLLANGAKDLGWLSAMPDLGKLTTESRPGIQEEMDHQKLILLQHVQDERLFWMSPFTFEEFLDDYAELFQDVSVREDNRLGKIFQIDFSGTRINRGREVEMSGRLELMADYFMLPVLVEVSLGVGENAQPLSRWEVEYPKELVGDWIHGPYSVRFTSNSGKVERVADVRPLKPSEIRELESATRLTHYGMKEPEGFERPTP